jgi:hypothetical protein
MVENMKGQIFLCARREAHREWKYRPTLSYMLHYMKMSGQFDSPTSLRISKSPRHNLNRRLVGPQNGPGRCRRQKYKFLHLPRTEPRNCRSLDTKLSNFLRSVYTSYTTTLTFRHRASSIEDRRFSTFQRTLFIYLINIYI